MTEGERVLDTMTLNWGVSTVKALVFVLVYAIAVLGVLLFGTTIYVVLAACGSPIPAWTPGGRRDALRFIDEDLST